MLDGADGDDILDGDANGFLGRPTAGTAPGADVLHGGSGDDDLHGGLGDDELDGDAGEDILEGDPPRTTGWPSTSAARGSDRIRGGTGPDHVVYNFQPPGSLRRSSSQTPRLRISLGGLPNDGPAGEYDNVLAGTELAYSLSTATLSPLGRGRGAIVRALVDTRGRSLDTSVGVRIYRLLGRGTLSGQSGLFREAGFRVRGARNANQTLTLALTGGAFAACAGTAQHPAAQTARRRHRTIRRLRSSARGRFRTRGRHSSATVRGTRWTTTDRCDGTLTTVTRGAVAVRDYARLKTIIVRAGHSYLARR